MTEFRTEDHPRGERGRFEERRYSAPEASLPLTTLGRDEVIEGLRALVHRLREVGKPATIQLVGGAAIALTVHRDRPPTRDIDASISPPEVVRSFALEIGEQRGWPDGWLDEGAAQFLPNQFGRGEEWVTVYDDGVIKVQSGSQYMLLAMKLLAMHKRPLRDAADTNILLTATGTSTAEEADDLFASFYPGENLSAKVYERVDQLLADGPIGVSVPAWPNLG